MVLDADYIIVPEMAYTFLKKIYDYEPPEITRFAVDTGSETIIDIFYS
jgi:hypothetical protein